MLGNHAMKYQPAIIDAAMAAGVTEFYPSEFGSDIGQGKYTTSRYWQDKRKTREYLRNVAKNNPGFNYTFLITGGFIEFALHPLFQVGHGTSKISPVLLHRPVRNGANKNYLTVSPFLLP